MKKVIFIFYLLELFNGIEYLYNYMKKTEDFEPILLVSPKIDKRQSNDNSDVIKYLKNKNYDFIEYDSDFNIKDLKPDYVFYSTPWNNLYPKNITITNIKSILPECKLCYFNYGYIIFSYKSVNYFCNLELKEHFDIIFLENEFVVKDNKIFLDKIKGKYFITGSPKVNYLLNYKNTNTNNKIKNILWCPRWIPYNSNFNKYYNFFLKLADNKNVKIIVRFHPLDKNNKRVFFFRIRKYKKNIKIDNNGSYIDLFEKTDIFISDLSTMIPQFYPTNKPIIYTYHKNNIANELINELTKGMYLVKSTDQLENTINKLLNNNDELYENRLKITKKYFNYNASENICNILKK